VKDRAGWLVALRRRPKSAHFGQFGVYQPGPGQQALHALDQFGGRRPALPLFLNRLFQHQQSVFQQIALHVQIGPCVHSGAAARPDPAAPRDIPRAAQDRHSTSPWPASTIYLGRLVVPASSHGPSARLLASSQCDCAFNDGLRSRADAAISCKGHGKRLGFEAVPTT
jgi:hypothetical protein